MAKVILIDLSDFSHNEIEINLENPLLPIATPLSNYTANHYRGQS